ncbi:DUF58 domain-containing protein [Lysobacter sp. TY2-98]|uniref:DUF58 domain-containing protein n=1 Tax=Lysobacter sp. TY2-98 TaxID=2290922 RepID=UPI000E1FDE5B|nr:DUF58 domain-containing protein [Lysobacter sp. TY2-98]AXK71141.1 DUF58 domain-containing protein [Lysobacter sp. TY2-98]
MRTDSTITVADGVTPTIAELVALRGIASSPRHLRRVRTAHAGLANSPMRGRGMEYAESREYTVGDDARHVDWRLTARTGRAHTKVFHAERERLTLLVADTNPALYFGTRVRFKSVQAARAGAVIAWNAVGEGDRVAVVRASPREAPVSPAGGPRGALRAIDALSRWYSQRPDDDLGLPAALERAQRLLRPGARVVVLADPASLEAVPLHRWSALARHHDAAIVLLNDPIETMPPQMRLPFSTGDARIEVALDDRVVRERWLARFAAPLQRATEALPGRGVRVMALSTTDPSDACLALLRGRVAQVA